MLLPLELVQHAAVPAAEAIVSGLWQGIALALVTGIVLRLLPGTSASARFAVWIAVFSASAAMPLVHLFAANPGTTAATSRQLVVDPSWSYLLAGLWVGASTLRFARLLAEAISLRKLWREATPLAPELLELANLTPTTNTSSRPERSGVERPPHFVSLSRKLQVCTTPDVDRPSVIGFFAPKILIPDWLCAQLSPTELRHIVLHEMEHLHRRDDWLNLLQKIGLVLFPLNPAMFWIDRRLSTEREIACDDGVLAHTKTPRAYAASLTSVAERHLNLNARRRMVALALGIFGAGKLFARRSEFAQRIESILNQRPASRPAVAAVLVAAIMASSAAIAHTPELVSFRAAPAQLAVSTPTKTGTTAKLPLPGNFAPHFENASFHIPARPHKNNVILPEPAAATAVQVKETGEAPAQPKRNRQPHPAAKPQWLLLTAWEQQQSSKKPATRSDFTEENEGGDIVVPASQVPVTRVIVRTPDGRFFLAPYAAVPTQAGWLIVQL